MDFLFYLLWEFFISFVLLFLTWVICTPFILIISFFKKGNYFQNLKYFYQKIKDLYLR